MNLWAVLLAAGRGSRLAAHSGGALKQFLPHQGLPLFWHSAETLARVASLRGLVLVFPPDPSIPAAAPSNTPAAPSATPAAPSNASGPAQTLIAAPDAAGRCDPQALALLAQLNSGGRLGLPVRVAPGGARRQDSVANGLRALPPECDAVLIHDSARPFASAALMQRIVEALEQGHPAVIPGLEVSDTIKCVSPEGRVLRTPDRSGLRAVQTPQGFALALLRNAHERAGRQGWEVTDDASLLELCGQPVLIVPGEETNRKITTAKDLDLLASSGTPGRGGLGQALAASSTHGESMPGLIPCTGFGYDVHRYGGDRPLLLGGVPIPCDLRVAAHSDGDVLLHALMDAILGCLGQGDIGRLFPDTDPAFSGISSGILLAEVLERAARSGLRLCHADVTVVAQTPRIAPHREAIAANLAKLLALPRACVNVKATTEEGLGFTGEKKGLKTMAVVSGLRPWPGGEGG